PRHGKGPPPTCARTTWGYRAASTHLSERPGDANTCLRERARSSVSVAARAASATCGRGRGRVRPPCGRGLGPTARRDDQPSQFASRVFERFDQPGTRRATLSDASIGVLAVIGAAAAAPVVAGLAPPAPAA